VDKKRPRIVAGSVSACLWFASSDAALARAARFGFVGAISTCIYAAIASILVGFVHLSPKPASVVAYLIAMPLNFLANRVISFRSDGPLQRESLRFVVMHVSGMAVAYGSMSLATDYLGSNYMVGIAIAAVLVPALSFLVANFWVFEKR
jgi:putative flippase GtrA